LFLGFQPISSPEQTLPSELNFQTEILSADTSFGTLIHLQSLDVVNTSSYLRWFLGGLLCGILAILLFRLRAHFILSWGVATVSLLLLFLSILSAGGNPWLDLLAWGVLILLLLLWSCRWKPKLSGAVNLLLCTVICGGIALQPAE